MNYLYLKKGFLSQKIFKVSAEFFQFIVKIQIDW